MLLTRLKRNFQMIFQSKCNSVYYQIPFNSIEWRWILKQIQLKQVPSYLKKIIRSYLSQRTLLFESQSSDLNNGIPQGSVLGQLLQNIAFVSVLKLRMSPGYMAICYLDDTLVVAGAALPIYLEWRINRVLRTVTD